MRWIVLIMLVVSASAAGAQEFHALGGIIQDAETHERANTWQLEYREGLGEHFAYSLTYLNEGHIPNHHRDGHGIQFWARTNLLDRRLSLSAGAGPYFYYDTTTPPGADFKVDDHGWGALVSLAAIFYAENRWLFQVRGNWAGTGSSIDTLALLVGIGYQLDPPPEPGPLPYPPSRRERTTRNEITAFLGETKVHNSGPGDSFAAGIEYRRSLWRYLDWSAAFLHEGKSGLARRNGVATQLWGVRALLEDRLALGFGAGPYVAVDSLRNNGNDLFVSKIVTMTGSYRLHPSWGLRLSWNRIITNYNRDADVWLVGAGYLF